MPLQALPPFVPMVVEHAAALAYQLSFFDVGKRALLNAGCAPLLVALLKSKNPAVHEVCTGAPCCWMQFVMHACLRACAEPPVGLPVCSVSMAVPLEGEMTRVRMHVSRETPGTQTLWSGRRRAWAASRCSAQTMPVLHKQCRCWAVECRAGLCRFEVHHDVSDGKNSGSPPWPWRSAERLYSRSAVAVFVTFQSSAARPAAPGLDACVHPQEELNDYESAHGAAALARRL